MASLLKRQLNDEEKKVVLQRHGRHCFATGHEIPRDEPIHFDHIHAHSRGGETDLNNIAPMCAHHNREKSQLSLYDFRVKLRLKEFFANHDKPTLRDLLEMMKKRGEIESFSVAVSIRSEGSEIRLDTAQEQVRCELHQCPTTDWEYFYATLPITMLDSDDSDGGEQIGLQPRYLIEDKVFSLFRHFQRHPVLQPSIGRISGNKIKIFDGQHKIAALLLNNRAKFECKIYIEPDLKLLNNTNVAAHDSFAQTRFYSSIMVLKLGAEFARDFEEFKASSEVQIKSEAAFFDFVLRQPTSVITKAELSKRFRSHLYSSVLGDPECRLDRFVSRSNRSTDEQPITMDMLEKSIFQKFLFREPTSDSMSSEAYRRDEEIKNVVYLCNALVDGALHAWAPALPKDNLVRLRLQRIFGSKSMMAWSELLWDAVCARLEEYDGDQRKRIFHRVLTAEEKERVRKTILRLLDWQRWDSPRGDQIDRILADNRSAVKDWFKGHGLTAGYLLGATT